MGSYPRANSSTSPANWLLVMIITWNVGAPSGAKKKMGITWESQQKAKKWESDGNQIIPPRITLVFFENSSEFLDILTLALLW